MTDKKDVKAALDNARSQLTAGGVEFNEDLSSFTMKLSRPIEFGQDTFTELTFSEPTFAQLKGFNLADLDDMPMDAMLVLAQELCTEPPSVVGKVKAKDAAMIAGAIALFFG